MSVSAIATSPMNQFHSFCVFPDGSNEGWRESDFGNECRDELIKFLNSNPGLDWVEIQYGDDQGETIITRRN